MGGTAQSIIQTFVDKGTSVHFLVGKRAIYRLFDPSLRKTFFTRNEHNDFSTGIMLIHPGIGNYPEYGESVVVGGESYVPFPRTQIDATFALVEYANNGLADWHKI